MTIKIVHNESLPLLHFDTVINLLNISQLSFSFWLFTKCPLFSKSQKFQLVSLRFQGENVSLDCYQLTSPCPYFFRKIQLVSLIKVSLINYTECIAFPQAGRKIALKNVLLLVYSLYQCGNRSSKYVYLHRCKIKPFLGYNCLGEVTFFATDEVLI